MAGITNTDTVDANRRTAQHLYWAGWRVARIADFLKEKPPTIHSWKKRGKWDDATPLQRIEGTLEARLVLLICKEDKEGRDFKEIDLLTRQIERLARIHAYNDSGKEGDLNPNIKGGRKNPKRNHLDDEQIEMLREAFEAGLYAYQWQWYEAKRHRIRNVLKSRQIGATFYFAREAIVDAFETGKNKIFLSASKAQAHIFKAYIVAFVKEVTGVELRGDPVILSNSAELHFLGTNGKTAQGYHGDVYLDEYFWIAGFESFRKVASAMATHKHWRQTYFSTPSSTSHEAYPFWNGDRINKRRAKKNRIDIDVSHVALKNGALCSDKQWKQIVTIDDAEEGGCDLFDKEELQFEYSQDEFSNLFRCEFLDDSQSAFNLARLQSCLVDSWEVWRDFSPFDKRPLGDQEVWLGYDPDGGGENGDGAGLVVLAPALSRTRKHRVIERIRLKGRDYEEQAAVIREMCDKYNVTFIGIDITGLGEAVAQHVDKFFPFVTRYRYSPDQKSQMVLQAQHIIDHGRLEFDAGAMDLVSSLLSIRRQVTKGGRAITYVSGRNGKTGHADLGWALLHALHNEPMVGPDETGNSTSFMEILD